MGRGGLTRAFSPSAPYMVASFNWIGHLPPKEKIPGSSPGAATTFTHLEVVSLGLASSLMVSVAQQ